MFSVELSWMVIMSFLLARPAVSFVARTSHRTIPLTMVSFDASSFTTRASKDDEDLVLDPLVVCGPSGVGKVCSNTYVCIPLSVVSTHSTLITRRLTLQGTIIDKYMEEHGGKIKFGFTVSHTTRSPRPGEEDGTHYHFAEMDDMRREISENKFLEYAEVHGNLYGTSWQSMRYIQLSGKHCLLDIDVQGVKRLKSLENPTLQPNYIFIAPPSLDILEKRLADRGTETTESLERRTANARQEMDYGLAPGNFDSIVVNDNLEDAVRQFAKAVDNAYPDLS